MYAGNEVERIERAIFLKGTISERADDLPLIIHWLKQMNIASIIDQELPPPHGNRKGLSYGQLSVLFLSYVVSQSDPRLCAVEAKLSELGSQISRENITLLVSFYSRVNKTSNS